MDLKDIKTFKKVDMAEEVSSQKPEVILSMMKMERG